MPDSFSSHHSGIRGNNRAGTQIWNMCCYFLVHCGLKSLYYTNTSRFIRVHVLSFTVLDKIITGRRDTNRCIRRWQIEWPKIDGKTSYRSSNSWSEMCGIRRGIWGSAEDMWCVFVNEHDDIWSHSGPVSTAAYRRVKGGGGEGILNISCAESAKYLTSMHFHSNLALRSVLTLVILLHIFS